MHHNLSEEKIEKLRSELSHIAFVAANGIRVGQDRSLAESHRNLADAFERIGLPVIVFGLGAQARIGQSVAEAVLPPEPKRLLSVISHLTPVIGVRGEFTAELCRHLGIPNVEVIGCQSCFISRRPDFAMPQLAAPPDIRRTVVNVTYHAQELPIIEEAMAAGAAFIGQSEHFEYELSRIPPGVSLDALPGEVKSLLHPGLGKLFDRGLLVFGYYHRWIHERFSQFFSIPKWFSSLQENGFEASIGTRFHGNMAAMQCGIPSLWIVHDSRTQEFCDYHGLPHAPLGALAGKTGISRLFEDHYRTDSFARRYPEGYARFHAYLEKHGVAHRLAPPSAP